MGNDKNKNGKIVDFMLEKQEQTEEDIANCEDAIADGLSRFKRAYLGSQNDIVNISAKEEILQEVGMKNYIIYMTCFDAYYQNVVKVDKDHLKITHTSDIEQAYRFKSRSAADFIKRILALGIPGRIKIIKIK